MSDPGAGRARDRARGSRSCSWPGASPKRSRPRSSRTSASGSWPSRRPRRSVCPLAGAIAGGVVGALALVDPAPPTARRRRADPRAPAGAGRGRDGGRPGADREARLAPRSPRWVRDCRSRPTLWPAWRTIRARVGRRSPRLALLNRLTRIVPVVAAFAVVGVLVRPLDVPAGLVALVYAIGWIALLRGILVGPARRRTPVRARFDTARGARYPTQPVGTSGARKVRQPGVLSFIHRPLDPSAIDTFGVRPP